MKEETVSVSKISKVADEFYFSKDYKAATDKYLKVIALADFKSQKNSAAYNAACCLALQKKIDSAFILLEKSVK